MNKPAKRWASKVLKDNAYVHLPKFDMVVDFNDTNFTPFLKANKAWEPKSTAIVEKLLKKGDTFIDCGAHWGYYTCLASKLVGRSGMIYAFEANPTNLFGLTMNLTLNDIKNAKIVPLAVWDSSVAVEFVNETPTIGHIVDEWKPWSRGNRIPACALDDWFEPNEVDFLKIDCEGTDAVVIRGAMKIITEGHPKIMIENPPVSILESLGYKVIYRFPENEEQTWFFEKE